MKNLKLKQINLLPKIIDNYSLENVYDKEIRIAKNTTLGQTIKNVRKIRKLTQEALGLKVEVTKSYISKIESGKQLPTIIQMKKISKALEIDYAYLLLKTADIENESEIDNKELLEKIVDKYNELNALYEQPFNNTISKEVGV